MFISASTRNQALEFLFRDNSLNDLYSLYASPSFQSDDIKSFVFEILCEKPEQTILYIFNKQEIKYYMLSIIKNQFCSSNSPYFTKIKSYQLLSSPLSFDVQQQENIEPGAERLSINKIKEILHDDYLWSKTSKKKFLLSDVNKALSYLSSIDKDTWYYSKIFNEIYSKDGGKPLRQFANETGINHVTIYNACKKIIDIIEQQNIAKAKGQ